MRPCIPGITKPPQSSPASHQIYCSLRYSLPQPEPRLCSTLPYVCASLGLEQHCAGRPPTLKVSLCQLVLTLKLSLGHRPEGLLQTLASNMPSSKPSSLHQHPRHTLISISGCPKPRACELQLIYPSQCPHYHHHGPILQCAHLSACGCHHYCRSRETDSFMTLLKSPVPPSHSPHLPLRKQRYGL